MDGSKAFTRYCERGFDPGFWAEPLNAITNAAFLVAALFGLWRLRAHDRRDMPALALCLLVGLIAIGSFLFHTIPSRATLLADVLPIQIFILAYLGLATVRYLGQAWWMAVLIVVLFLPVTALVAWACSLVGFASGGGYMAALLALVAVSIALRIRAARFENASIAGNSAIKPKQAETAAWLRQVSSGLALAAAVFGLSLTFRSLDLPLCGSFPIGTHFLWHLLNATVLGILLSVAVRHPAPLAAA